MKWVLGTAIGFLLFTSYAALADERRGEAGAGGPMPEPSAIICLDRASGQETEIGFTSTCPNGHQVFLRLQDVEPSPGAAPLSLGPQEQEQQQQAEARDAPPDRK